MLDVLASDSFTRWHRDLLRFLLTHDGASLSECGHKLETMRCAVRERAAQLEAMGLVKTRWRLFIDLTPLGRAVGAYLREEGTR